MASVLITHSSVFIILLLYVEGKIKYKISTEDTVLVHLSAMTWIWIRIFFILLRIQTIGLYKKLSSKRGRKSKVPVQHHGILISF